VQERWGDGEKEGPAAARLWDPAKAVPLGQVEYCARMRKIQTPKGSAKKTAKREATATKKTTIFGV